MATQDCIVAIISPDRRIHEEIASALDGRSGLEDIWTLAEYPDAAALAAIGQARKGSIIFLDFTDPLRAHAVAAEIDSTHPRSVIIAILSPQLPDLSRLMQVGIREVVTVPLNGTEVVRAFTRAGRKLQPPEERNDGGNVYAFLPAKPGVGATTLATYSAAATARLTAQTTLLLDFDFRLGMTSFLLRLSGDHSVLDAIRSQDHLGAELWDRMVCRRGSLDILGSAPVDFAGSDPEAGAVSLVDLARRAYAAICVDLPGEMRDYEVDTISRAKECFLVVTPELGALHMAKRKAEMLHGLGLQSKVSVIMNRISGRNGLGVGDIETILQLPVRVSVPESERQISEAVQAGRAVEGRSPLAAQIETIARRINPAAIVANASKTRRFIDLFSVSRVREAAAWDR